MGTQNDDDSSEYQYEILSVETIDGVDGSADSWPKTDAAACSTTTVVAAAAVAARVFQPQQAAAHYQHHHHSQANDTFTLKPAKSVSRNPRPTDNGVVLPLISDHSMDGTVNDTISRTPNFESDNATTIDDKKYEDYRNNGGDIDLLVNIQLKRKKKTTTEVAEVSEDESFSEKTCLPLVCKMFPFLKNCNLSVALEIFTRKFFFLIVLILSVIALVLLHNSSLRTRRTANPTKFFISNNPFIADFEHGQLKELWSRITQNDVSFIIYYAPWDSDCMRARNEFEVVANHYGQQIFFGAINCWWPEGECKKYQNIRRFPHFVAHIRTEGEVEYTGPILASYIIPFLDNVLSPVTPIQNEGELLDLRAKHDAVVLGYFDFNKSPHQSNYRSYLATAIKALKSDPWRSVAYTVITNSKTASKLKIDPSRDNSLILYAGNGTEHFTVKSSKSSTTISWIYSRADHSSTVKWFNPSGIKSLQMSDYIHKRPTLILFTPRSFILGISPYFDLLREIVLDYYNCDNSPIIRSLIHRNILRRRLLEDKFSELEERCHEILDEEEVSKESKEFKRFSDTEDTCCHSQTVKWRSFGGARRGMTKKCLCTSCVHISLPKCPARCNHFDCLSTAARFLDDFDPNFVNNSAVYCNQIKTVYEPKYTSYYKISTTCSGLISPSVDSEDNSQWNDVNRHSILSSDDKISQMIQDFEIQHCRRLKLGMNYTDLNFPDSSDVRKNNWRANFSGLACRTNRTLKFMALDSSLYPAFAESLGIDVFNVPHSTIAVIIDPQKESVHVLDHEILYEEVEMPNFESKSIVNVPVNSYSKKTFIEFIKNYTDGSLPRFLRSKMVSSSGLCDLKQMIIVKPSSNNSVICVPELNSLTFINYIMEKSFDGKDDQLKSFGKFSNKDFMVMYYAPWCGFCTSIAHVYLDVARFFAFSSDIIFTRINGDANDLPWEYTVDRYPTLMFFPAKRRSNSIVYPTNQPITKAGLFQFILEHSQPSVKLQTMLTFCRQSCLLRTTLSSHRYRSAIYRALRHNRNSLALFRLQLQENRLKSLHSNATPKESNKLANRKSQLEKHVKYIESLIRKLQRILHKQSLLSHFLLLRVKQFTNDELHFRQNNLNDELYRLIYQKSVSKKSSPTPLPSSKVDKNPSPRPSKPVQSKPKKTSKSKDEL